ncbi:MAG TPA: DUF5597 domain-containing protein [Caulobacterales bacterium]|nr:DUF5597 domain-containing protein [Caulobacterales bacterium]
MRWTWLIAVLTLAACHAASQTDTIPRLARHGSATQLIVDGKPFLVLGGELGNSTASDLAYLDRSWPLFDALHMNTVLAPVTWETIEPREGEFDFSQVDGLINAAYDHRKRLVLLWFGSWKNSMSSYVPAWVKRNEQRFPRARDAQGRSLEMLSAFVDANRNADAAAFRALMAHLREMDGKRHVVLMVQVENEIGMIPSARDHGDAANAAYAAPVPYDALHAVLAERAPAQPFVARSWPQAFGDSAATEELFMAWHFARYTEAVAAAGKSAYPLPMYVNAALLRPGKQPGEYPSAGPLPHVFDVWRAGAPSIDLLAPDIYFPNFVEWSGAYARSFPLFVPETGRAPEATPANAFFAFGEHDAIGFSPFAIEDYKPDDRLGKSYATLRELAPLILAHQGDRRMRGFRAPLDFEGNVDDTPQDIALGGYTFHIAFRQMFRAPEDQDVRAHGGLIIQLGEDEFLIAGSGLTITFSADGANVGIESAIEGRYVDGRWRPGRWLNGDETHQGRHVRFSADDFTIQRVRLYRYH